MYFSHPLFLQHRHHHIPPEPAHRHDKHHGGDHISNREVVDFCDAETCGQKKETATGLEVRDHIRCGKRKDELRRSEDREKDHTLRDRNSCDHHSQGSSKDHRGKEVQNGLGDEDRVVTAHSGVQGTIDSRSAGTEQHDDRHEHGHVLFSGHGRILIREDLPHRLLHARRAVVDDPAEIHRQPKRGPNDHRKDNGGHIFHKTDGAHAHSHGADAEDLRELRIDPCGQLMSK